MMTVFFGRGMILIVKLTGTFLIRTSIFKEVHYFEMNFFKPSFICSKESAKREYRKKKYDYHAHFEVT